MPRGGAHRREVATRANAAPEGFSASPVLTSEGSAPPLDAAGAPAPRHCTASESSSSANAIERDNGAWITREHVRARVCACVRVCVFARACVPCFRPRALPAENPKRVRACAALLSLLARQLSTRQPIRIYQSVCESLRVENARQSVCVCVCFTAKSRAAAQYDVSN